jgi:formylglycine-generating enzyme required for sulfatase activity
MKTIYTILVALCLNNGIAFAKVTFDWTIVSDAGNASDQDYGEGHFGAVDYTYRISSYEVANDQYVEFLNNVAFSSDPHGLFQSEMDITRSGTTGSFTYSANPGFGLNPVNHVSFRDALRFVNWLHNGQGNASTDDGVYTIGNGVSETRSPLARYFIPSENEWYKAAYYDPRLATEGGPPNDDHYWLFPTQSDSAPTVEAPPGGPNSANGDYVIGDTTNVGAYLNATSFYGTFDQGGNLVEWNEALVESSARGLRGGSWFDPAAHMAAAHRRVGNPAGASPDWGFRIAGTMATPDFNNDGLINCIDVDSLVGEIAGGTNRATFDLTSDGVVDIADLREWLVQGGAANLPSGNPYLVGDATLNGVVDGLDYIEWNAHKFTSTAAWCSGDFNADGVVDGLDFFLWNDNKFTSSDVASVPEPCAGILLISALIGLAVVRRS